jgi:predicted neuraminidase
MTRTIHPAVHQYELWPGPAGYPWASTGIRLWTREGILRRVAPGHLICTWTTGGFSEPTEGNFAMISRSQDDGRTWSAPEVLFRHAHRGLFTTELFVPREGEIHAFLQTYALGAWMTQLDSYRSISRDGGLTWSCPNSIPGGIQNVWVNSGIVHASGRWIIPVSWAEHCGDEWCEPSIGRPPTAVAAGPGARQPVELPWGADKALLYQTANAWADRNHRYVAGVMLSDDQGASFRLRGYLCREDARHFIEPKVVELSDGRLVIFAREKWQGWIWRSESADGGETWTPIERTDIPNPSSKFRLLRASGSRYDGRIFLLHNPAGIQPDGKWGRRSPLSLWISDDDMRTWRTKVDLVSDTERNLNYPDGFLDEERGEVRFAWEDAYSVYVAAVPMDVG